jgi:hypothetical protein
MGQFKQMQIQFDDDYFNNQGESYTEEEEENPMPEYDSSIEDTHDYPEEEKPKTSRSCKHKIKCVLGRTYIATYCEKCGKVFDVKKK